MTGFIESATPQRPHTGRCSRPCLPSHRSRVPLRCLALASRDAPNPPHARSSAARVLPRDPPTAKMPRHPPRHPPGRRRSRPPSPSRSWLRSSTSAPPRCPRPPCTTRTSTSPSTIPRRRSPSSSAFRTPSRTCRISSWTGRTHARRPCSRATSPRRSPRPARASRGRSRGPCPPSPTRTARTLTPCRTSSNPSPPPRPCSRRTTRASR